MAKKEERIRLGKISIKKFDDFLKANLKGRVKRRASLELAGGICGAWGCGLYDRSGTRRIKGCYKIIYADGRVETRCVY